MANVALTNQEKATLIGDGGAFKSACQQKVLFECMFRMGLSATDLNTFQKQKHRKYAALVKSDLNRLLGDSSITGFFVACMMVRGIAFKDDADGQASLADQVIAYLNAASRFDILVADWMDEKVRFEPYE